jgi:hypothetical protein|nr:fibronectin type III domain-containing protein [uncultured Psychroserpens sp.]
MQKSITLLIFMLSLLYSGTILAQQLPDEYDPAEPDELLEYGFHFKIQTTTTNETFTIPTSGSGYDYKVNWGDSNTNIDYSGSATHTYGNPGIYYIKLVPNGYVESNNPNISFPFYGLLYTANGVGFPRIHFNNTGDKDKIISIEQWGLGAFNSMESAFYGCSNMVNNATDTPNLGAASFKNIFNGATLFNANLGNWPIIVVNNMEGALSNSGLTQPNYDSTLAGWANQTVAVGPQNLGADNLVYCSTTGRDILINDKGWTINGDTACDPCPAPTNLIVSDIDINGTDVTLDWDYSNPSVTNWEWATSSSTTPPTSGTPFSGATNTTITGLTQNTSYNFWVRANCGSGVLSPWSNMVTATTPLSCIAPTDLEISLITNDSAQLDFTPGSDESSWEYYYYTDPASEASAITYSAYSTSISITGLLPDGGGLFGGAGYTVKLRAVCNGARGASAWSQVFFQISNAFVVTENNECAGVDQLAESESPFTGTNDNSYDTFNQGCLSNAGRDVIYSFSVPDRGLFTMNYTSDFDSFYRVAYGDSCPGDVELACSSADNSMFTWVNTTGETQILYWIVAGSKNPEFNNYFLFDTVGNFTFDWTIVSVDSIPSTTVPDDNFENYLETHDANGAVVPLGHPNSMGNGGANDNLVFTSRINTIQELDIGGKNISDLTGIEGFTELITLKCDNNSISNINAVEGLTNLTILYCNNNVISNLNLNLSLDYMEQLICSNNPITSIDLSKFPILEELTINTTGISELDVSQNPDLRVIIVNSNNQLTSLDFSNNAYLLIVECNYNPQLTSINLNNNNNEYMSGAQVRLFSDNLVCVQVDNVGYASLNWYNIENPSVYQTYCDAFSPQTVVPDDNFENYLETHDANGAVVPLGDPTSMGNGIANDNIVFTPRISGVTDLNINNQNISDLTGIEDFASLSVFACIFNQITSINLNQNLNLTYLECGYNNQLTNLDVTQCSNLETLRIYNSTITELDISENLNLTYLVAGGAESQLTSLDASQNTNLTNLYVYDSQVITSLNLKNGNNTFVIESYLPNNPNLTCVQVDDVAYATANWFIDDASVFSDYCTEFLTYVPDNNFENYLETHNASGSTVPLGDPTSMGNGVANDNYVFTPSVSGVTALDVYGQNIVDLTGVENFTALTYLVCGNNQIESLDVSQNLALTNLFAYNNQLKNVNLGSNTNFIPIFGLDLNGNPELTCITVEEQATADLWNTENYFNDGSGNSTLDPQMVFNTFCTPYGSTYVPDDNFENYLETHNSSGAVVALGSSSSLGNGIANDDLVITSKLGGLNGFEGFRFNGLSIASLEGIQDFTDLVYLECSNNLLTSVNLEDLPPNLLIAIFSDNPLAQIEGNNSVLEILDCSNTNLTSLDVSNCPALEILDCSNANLTSLDVSNCPALEVLWANDNPQLVNLNVKNGNNVNFGQAYVPIKTTNCPNLTCIEVDDVAYSTTNWTEIDVHTAFSTNCGEVTLEAKAYLQGAFMNPNAGEETLMRDDLRTLADFPLTSPYGDGLTITATELAVSGPDAIVDWIWVELRDDATNTTVIASQSALLQRDGDIVDIDGTSPIVFSENAKHYNVVIKHRNHLGVMSSTRVSFPKDQVVDFQSGAMTSFGTNGQTSVSGIFTLWAGNVNDDGVIRFSGNNNDTNALKAFILANAALPLITFPVNGYYNSDIDLNGITKFSGADNDSNFIKASILNPVINPLGFLTTTISTQVPNN